LVVKTQRPFDFSQDWVTNAQQPHKMRAAWEDFLRAIVDED
jgi:hypothetical protein